MSDDLIRFLKDSGWAFASLAIASVVQFVLRIFLARYFGPADLGLYTLAFTVYSFGLVAACIGTDFALTKYVAAAGRDSKINDVLVTSGLSISFVSGLAMGLVLYLMSPYIAGNFFKMPELTPLLRIVSFAYPFIGLEKATLGFLNGLRRMRVFAFINILQGILVIIGTVIFAIAGYGIEYAEVALVIPLVFMSLIGLLSIRESFSLRRIAQALPILRMLLAFGFFLVLGNAMGVVQTYADSTLLGHFMKNVDVGHYAVAGVLILAVRMPPQAIQTITGPMIARYWGANEIDNIQRLIDRCVKYTTFYAVLSTFVLIFLGEDLIVSFFGAEYLAAVLPFRILLVGTLFASIQASVGSALESTAYVKMQAVITAASLLLGILLNLSMIPMFGIAGAAAATSTALAASALTRLYFTQRLIGTRIDWVWIVKLLGFVVMVGAFTFVIANVLNLYVSILLALVILMTVMLKYFVNSEDRGHIRQILHLRTGD